MPSASTRLRADTVAAIQQRIANIAEERVKTQRKVASGAWRDAEPDATRSMAYSVRLDRKAGHAEAVRGTNDFQPAAFLSDGAKARRAVARTVLDTREESRTATGFLISPRLFMTNQHVVRSVAEAALTQIIFDDELDERGDLRPVTTFQLDPKVLFISSDEAEFDYSVIAVGRRVSGSAAIEDFGYCPISQSPDRHQLGINANIVQHPEGRKKVVVLRNNLIVARDDPNGRLFYDTDTLTGSSGSPVFNDLWDVVALHHYGEANQDLTIEGRGNTRAVNEGIRISSIYDQLSGKTAELDSRASELLREALVLWKSDMPAEKTLRIGARPAETAVASRGAIEPSTSTVKMDRGENKAMSSLPEAKILIPLEITARIGAAGIAPVLLNEPRPLPEVAPLRSLAEAKRIDRDYSNRNGYDPAFLDGLKIDLADVVAPVKKKVAPLLKPQKNRAPGELPYQNFSVVMHKSQGIAILTATNIDGETYIAIDRKTGKPAKEQPKAEGDTWYKDHRIDAALTLTNDFYGEWSQFFDRGHLTRRNDPTWGPDAGRANVDTFHFTNCSPQHWRFNQSSKFWQGIERYVLEQGLWETGLNKRLTVFQGPLYDAPQPRFADEVEIPNAYWKVVIWKGAGGLKAVALVADQTDLMTIPRRTERADEDELVDVIEFRATVADIANRSGLNLDAISPYDTAAGDLPKVGEARQVLTAWDQLGIR